MKRTEIKALLASHTIGDSVNIKGWVKSSRQRFVHINDGSTINNIQAVIDIDNIDDALLKRITVASCVSVIGKIVASQGSGQTKRIQFLESLGPDARTESLSCIVHHHKESIVFVFSPCR